MADVSWELKVYIVAGFTLIALWPFTHLVLEFSASVGHVTRTYLVYHTRDTTSEPSSQNGA